jgi:hypothetical protein
MDFNIININNINTSCIFFLKDTLTVPKVKDLIHQPIQIYTEIEKTLASNKDNINTNLLPSVVEFDKLKMKNELKQYFNELSNPSETSKESLLIGEFSDKGQSLSLYNN